MHRYACVFCLNQGYKRKKMIFDISRSIIILAVKIQLVESTNIRIQY